MCDFSDQQDNNYKIKIYSSGYLRKTSVTLEFSPSDTLAHVQEKFSKMVKLKSPKCIPKFPFFPISIIELIPCIGHNILTAFKPHIDDTMYRIFGPFPPLQCKDEDAYSLRTRLSTDGLLGGKCNLEIIEKCFVVKSNTNEHNDIRFETFRLCCSSHVFNHDSNYAGIVLYAYEGQTDWRLNSRHCKSGYTVILDTGKLVKLAEEENWPGTEGIVHGLVYYYIFRCGIENTVGEGFSIMKGVVKWNSTTFNARETGYHDKERIISDTGKNVLDEMIRVWKEFGIKSQSLPTESCRNFPFSN